MTGKLLKFKMPRTYNEKLQWLKIHDKKCDYTKLVDKIEVKEYIASTIGEEYIIPTIGIWNTFEEISFEKLPNQFVLKCSHDSGTVILCTDKAKFDLKQAEKKIKLALKRNYYWLWRELPYKNVEPRILAEEYIVDESESELKDYKFFCFHGKVEYIQVHFDRFRDHKRNTYNRDWDLQDFGIGYPPDKEQTIRRPLNLDKMIDISETLSNGIAHLRVDLYSVNGQIYFGELTFFHGGGFLPFKPAEVGYHFGDLITLEVDTKIRKC